MPGGHHVSIEISGDSAMPWCRVGALTAFALLSWSMPTMAQPPAPRVDFGREVQPILRDRCYGCHGPDQQMNGFRLDRRADALRGGSQTVIGPGNAEGTLLYRRLVDTNAGARMPPSGPLPAAEIAVIKAWIDQGVEWPDDLAGIPSSPPVDPAAARLATLIRDGDRGAIDVFLRASPGAARARAEGGTTPLMAAALYGDTDLMTRLMLQGADPHASNVSGATALMWALPDTAKMRLLLAADVNVDARSEERRTALVIATGIVGAAPAVQLLLDTAPARFQPGPGTPCRYRWPHASVMRTCSGCSSTTERTDPESGARLLRTNCLACARAAWRRR